MLHRAIAASLLLVWLSASAGGAPPRYAALLAGGQRLQGEKLSDWHEKNALPRLDGQPLLDPANPLRWIRDRWLPLAELPQAYVELHGGDRLPGVVSGYSSGLEQPFAALPSHFVVQSGQVFQPPENRPVTEIRVAAQSVRRIVWQRRGRPRYQPGTALYRDGRSLRFRAVRLQAGQVHLLLDEGGDIRIPWSDLAELHLPAVDAWSACFDELAQLCPTVDTRLYQVETTAGLIATASLARLAPRFEGNSSEADQWVHGIQPAWSLDILWVPCREMVYRRSWLPREVPLSRLPFAASSGSATGEPNRNAPGGPLRSGSLDFGGGLGVHGRCELAIELPAGVKGFRTQLCLDRAAGKGGCMLGRVFVNDAKGGPLWQSPLLVGSEGVADTGNLPLSGPAGGQKRLILQIDPVTTGRPAGVDPLEIRDYANWCDPLLELDPAIVQGELDKRLGSRFSAWKDWSVRFVGAATAAEAGLEVSSQRNERLPLAGSFNAAIQLKTKPLAIARRLILGPDDAWLLIGATRPPGPGREPKLEIFIGGEPVAEWIVAERQQDADENRPLAIPLANYLGREATAIDVEIRQLSAGDSAAVEYRLLQTAAQLPTLHCLFEEQGTFTPLSPSERATASVIGDDRHSGSNALKVSPGGEFRRALAQPLRIRERPAWGEHRFVRFALRKQGGGRAAVGLEAADRPGRPARYDAGRGEPAYGSAVRIWQDELPKEWIVINRDLFADFGNLDVQSLVVGCPDGEALLVDHVYLARGPHDLDRIPAAPSAAATNDKARQELARPIVERARPATVRIEFADGRLAAGVLIQEGGEVLTAGHALVAPGRAARVQLADGTTLAAKTLGIAREFDLGLLRIEPAGAYPKLEAVAPAELPLQPAYFALGFPAGQQEFQPAAVEIVSLRRVFRSTVWTDLADADWLTGGPLLDRDGRLVGIQSRQSRFGGALCTRFQDAWQHLPRVRNGEVFGAWQAGCEPILGVPGSGGLLPGDVVTGIDGRPIVGDEDIPPALAERDAGQEVTVDFKRGAAAMQTKIKLAPRVP